MKLVMLSSESITQTKDKKTQALLPTPKYWQVSYGLAESGKVIEIFMSKEQFEKLGLSQFILDKSDIKTIYADYKSVDVVFDNNKNIIAVEEVKG
jgi:hypothetical protein